MTDQYPETVKNMSFEELAARLAVWFVVWGLFIKAFGRKAIVPLAFATVSLWPSSDE